MRHMYRDTASQQGLSTIQQCAHCDTQRVQDGTTTTLFLYRGGRAKPPRGHLDPERGEAMTTPKRLSPEVLEECLRLVGATGPTNGNLPTIAAALRDHIAELETEMEMARKGVDPGSPAEASISALERHISELEKSLENARKERDEAVADNAALLAAGLKTCLCHGKGEYLPSCSRCDDSTDDHECPGWRKCEHDFMEPEFKRPHPGAALLEEHRKEIDRWQENVETVKGERDVERRLRLEQGEALAACQQHVRETGDDHRKALVRARNEGLEKAAREADTRGGPSLAWRIRAMKEPEPT